MNTSIEKVLRKALQEIVESTETIPMDKVQLIQLVSCIKKTAKGALKEKE